MLLKSYTRYVHTLRCVRSPGFYKDDFMRFLIDHATRVGDTPFLKQRSKFIKAHTSSGFKRAIDELLGDPDFQSRLGDVKAADEVRALQQFHDVLSADSDRACYSFKHVAYADDQLAVDTLLVTDSLFKSADFKMRKVYVALVESVKAHGGKVGLYLHLYIYLIYTF